MTKLGKASVESCKNNTAHPVCFTATSNILYVLWFIFYNINRNILSYTTNQEEKNKSTEITRAKQAGWCSYRHPSSAICRLCVISTVRPQHSCFPFISLVLFPLEMSEGERWPVINNVSMKCCQGAFEARTCSPGVSGLGQGQPRAAARPGSAAAPGSVRMLCRV